mgnify:CR=1 FL=1
MDLSLFDYYLPPELIAQHPVPDRSESRLLAVSRAQGNFQEYRFREIAGLLRQGDVLVINDTHVYPARLLGEKDPGGARIEMLLLDRLNETDWQVIAYRANRLSAGTRVRFSDAFASEVLASKGDGRFIVRFSWQGDWDETLARHGAIPLPPYIERSPGNHDPEDPVRYQTVYARKQGRLDSPAAPTAGLHFTAELLQQIRQQGVEIVSVTLQIGLDTFQPLRSDTVEDHKMHHERYHIPIETAQAINQARRQGRRIVAVGTTALRTLEGAHTPEGIPPGEGQTDLYIYPGYTFQVIDALITNFHLPRSSLLLLVSAFMGNELRKRVYEYAVEQRFRFFSYGDAMLIE